MKKSELKQIIKEEIQKILTENGKWIPDWADKYWDNGDLQGLLSDENYKTLEDADLKRRLKNALFNHIEMNR
jgi:hypothetical protein